MASAVFTRFIPSARRTEEAYATLIKQGQIDSEQSLAHLFSALLGPGIVVALVSSLFLSIHWIELLQISTAVALLSFPSAMILPQTFPKLANIQNIAHKLFCLGLLGNHVFIIYTMPGAFEMLSSALMIGHILSLFFLENRFDQALLKLPQELDTFLNRSMTDYKLSNSARIFQNKKPSAYHPVRAAYFFVWGVLFLCKRAPLCSFGLVFHYVQGAQIFLNMKISLEHYLIERNHLQKSQARLQESIRECVWWESP